MAGERSCIDQLSAISVVAGKEVRSLIKGIPGRARRAILQLSSISSNNRCRFPL